MSTSSTSTGLAPLGQAFSPQGLASMSMGVQRQVRRDVERVQGQAIIAKLNEDARAALTNVALEHVGALSTLEAHIVSIAPHAEARVREIVDSYTIGAAAAIRRWS